MSNTRHVCTYLNAFSTLILNIVMKFNNFDISKKFWICSLLTPFHDEAQQKNCLLVCHNFFRKGSVGRFFSPFFLLVFHTKSRSVGGENFLETFLFFKTFFCQAILLLLA